jgi:trans-2-enoyl-CoA reductase
MSKELPSIAGIEGVAVVEKVGSSVTDLEVNDWVLPHKALLGTWTQSTKADQSSVVKISNDIPVPYAATLGVNPCTAYRMLRDFVDLKPGDVIIQNGANSMVGYAVIQMAREMGVKTINVIRKDRPDTDIVQRLLSNLGGDVNITDDYVNTKEFKEIADELGPIKLAFDCVGGETVTHMSRTLAPGATIVTYGAMSKKPITVPFDIVSSKMLKMRGFWISKWMEENSIKDRSKMLNDISRMIKKGALQFFFEMHDLDDFQYAIEASQKPFRLRKVVLNVDFPDRFKEHDDRDPREYDMYDELYDPAT